MNQERIACGMGKKKLHTVSVNSEVNSETTASADMAALMLRSAQHRCIICSFLSKSGYHNREKCKLYS